MKKLFNIQTIIILIIILLPAIAHATDPGNLDEPDAPIDGGLSLLIIGGVGYGIRKVSEKVKVYK